MDELIRAAESAARLLKSDIFLHSVIAANRDIVAEWVAADTVGGREEAHAEMRALSRLIGRLERVMTDHPQANRAAELSDEVTGARQAAEAAGQPEDMNGDD